MEVHAAGEHQTFIHYDGLCVYGERDIPPVELVLQPAPACLTPQEGHTAAAGQTVHAVIHHQHPHPYPHAHVPRHGLQLRRYSGHSSTAHPPGCRYAAQQFSDELKAFCMRSMRRCAAPSSARWAWSAPQNLDSVE
ncbi:hypothetical protein AMD26_018810 [Deinococcus sp. UR1]|nr:hypothetical protein AMD26_018810 [Deinococcus sp. UR1]